MLDALFQGDALWFSVPALIGTGVFVLRLALMMIGGDGSDAGDLNTDFGDGGDMGGEGHDSSGAFAIFSIQTVSVFLMGFGWVGIGCLFGAGWGHSTSLGLGVVGGIVMVWIMTNILGAVHGLESDGNISIEGALGLTGVVYTRLPAAGDGRGQVRVVIDKRQRIYNAVSNGPEVQTQRAVRVVAVNDDNSLTVEPV